MKSLARLLTDAALLVGVFLLLQRLLWDSLGLQEQVILLSFAAVCASTQPRVRARKMRVHGHGRVRISQIVSVIALSAMRQPIRAA